MMIMKETVKIMLQYTKYMQCCFCQLLFQLTVILHVTTDFSDFQLKIIQTKQHECLKYPSCLL